MRTLESYTCGRWTAGTSNPASLHNATTGEAMATASSHGVDLGAAVRFARERGGPALRAMTFAQRGELLRKMSDAIVTHRDELLGLAMQNGGNTRSDAKFDVDGASGTLAAYADHCKTLGDGRFLVDGEPVSLGRSSRLSGQHVAVPRHGVAVQVNAFNFPAWGMAEKAACSLAAGMPFLAKPATATALVAWRIMQVWVEQGVLPEGVGQFIAGGAGDLLDHLGPQDVLAFTGSSDTAVKLRGHRRVLEKGVHVNVEADSLNVAVAGPDLQRGTATYDLFINNVVKEMTQKAGQKCTAIRRVFVSADGLESVREDLLDRLSTQKVGDPQRDDVTVGPLATAQQKRDVLAGMQKLMKNAKVILGGPDKLELLGADPAKGYFVMPTLLEAPEADRADEVHAHEVFGPLATLLVYRDAAHAAALAARGEGGLVASVYSDDKAFSTEVFLGLAPHHGRVCVGSEKVAGQFIPPGTVMPMLVHGGPGRAGGGEELGGTRGMMLYTQRTAVQAFGPWLEALAAMGKRVG
ncbi:MAG: 3,4-dehydroadipyl-CoA semialdehyde dehydrogenase [Deltaproteobacteria bacterium]|nr:3,4-dehydroadipyl-CoA semialdehyde dehydrogenase [Deltaproteobacteria bacterium]